MLKPASVMPMTQLRSSLVGFYDSTYCKRGNFRVGVIFAFSRFCLLRENYPHAKIKPICLYEGNRSIIVKITPT